MSTAKLICDQPHISETQLQTPAPAIRWRDPESLPAADLEYAATTAATTWNWNDVAGLEEQQRRYLQQLYSRGVLWQPRGDGVDAACSSVVFRLSHGGDVLADGNCLFSASLRAMESRDMDAQALRRRTVDRFLEDYESASPEEKCVIDGVVRHMYAPDLKSGWGIHVVQEVKVLAKKADRVHLDSSIDELLPFGMPREEAVETIYRERCVPVIDGLSWAKYMLISGSSEDDYDVITFQYTEEGLFFVDENRNGRAAAFGDDIAIQSLATEFKREIYIVQAHGSDAMVEQEHCIFFLPHHPRSNICEPPLFLFMKGTGWCGAGADHYEPLLAHRASLQSAENVAVIL